MDILSFYGWLAVLSGAIFVLQWLFTVFGMDVSDASGLDTGINEAVGLEGSGISPLFSYFSLRNVVNFTIAFALTGYFLERDYSLGILTPILAIGVGISFVVVNGFIFSLFMALQRDTDIGKSDLIGKEGTVLIEVPAKRSGRGKIHVSVRGNSANYFVLTDGKAISASSTVVVTEVFSNWELLVSSAS